MWLLKGVLSGLLLFGIFTIMYFRGLTGPIRQNAATSLSVITQGVIYEPWYWAVFLSTMVTSGLWAWTLHLVFARRPPF